ncbi:putative quinol monooxygenase [Sphingosinithalassobacter sp. CS137]|uniref:putative quinol monooxygenase n=1 Tax=Sphingosinithalassobacter sp. CS137 TaxID=2762748 RepID=UPI00165E542A|nr:putative quinol monooxygenase [Sphingosinithalassobacter sp. CS137]
MPYTVFATITVKPEHIDAACAAVAEIVPATRGEAGCVAFEPRRAVDGSARIFIFEEWTDRAAFDFHHSQDYTKNVFAKYEGWLQQAPELVEVKPLEG